MSEFGPRVAPIGLGVATLAVIAFVFSTIATRAQDSLEQALQNLAGGRTPLNQLTVIYTDLHALHGGLTMTILGSGKVTQAAVRVAVSSPKDLTESDLRNLVKLLIELHAWEQRVPERSPAPDESRAYLRIRVGSTISEVWEWFNDLDRNNRLVRIRETMKQVAWGSRSQ